MNSLWRWCDVAGILVDSRLELCQVNDEELESEKGSYALTACAHIGSGELLAYIPDDWIISRRTVRAFAGDEELSLALSLLWEQQKGLKSRFYGYLNSLPKASIALAWDPSSTEAFWLAGTETERALRRAERTWLIGVPDGFCISRLHAYWMAHHEQAGIHASLWPKFVDAFALVSSRAFVLNEWHGLAMVPIADIFNHADMQNVQIEADNGGNATTVVSSSGIVVRSSAAIEAGEEAINSYGELSNSELLCRYGFVLDARTGWERSSWDCGAPSELTELVEAFSLHESAPVCARAVAALEPRCAYIQRTNATDCFPPPFVDERGTFDIAPVLARDKTPLFIDAMGRPSWPLWQLAIASALYPNRSLEALVEVATSDLVCWPSDVTRSANDTIRRLCQQRLNKLRVTTEEHAALEVISVSPLLTARKKHSSGLCAACAAGK